MAPVDWVILGLYLCGVAALGLWFRRRQERPNEFFLAGRGMGWFPIGLSVMVTAFSAINYTAFSGEVFQNGLYVTLSLPVFVIVAWPVTRIFMPFYHSMQLCSAYEYLERRFDVRVRCLASGLYILWQLAWMAVVLYVPCRVLGAVTGLPFHQIVLLAGSVAALYTMAGGMRAVMWTDVAQFFVLLAGLVIGVVVAAEQSGGFAGMFQLAVRDGLMKPFYPADPTVLSPNPDVRISMWSALIGTFVMFLARYGADQTVVQRYFTARSLRDARRGFHLNYVSALVALGLLALLGFAMHAQAVHAGTPGLKPMEQFASFIRALPAGVAGLIVAGLFAATMSSIDSGINSCSAAFVTDFYGRLFETDARRANLHYNVFLGRTLVVVFASAAVGLSFYVGRLGTVFEIVNKVINSLGSPLLAVMLLGMFSRRVNAPGMLIGGVLGAVWSVAAPALFQSISLHYYAVSNLAITLIACYGYSLLFGRRPSRAQLEWTWRAVRSRERDRERL